MSIVCRLIPRLAACLVGGTFLVTAAGAQEGSGYAFANHESEASYAPPGAFSYNSTGGRIAISRSGAGRYSVRFEGLGGHGVVGGHVQVTAYGEGNEVCRAVRWDARGDDFVVSIACFDPGGRRGDSAFGVLVIWPPKALPEAGPSPPDSGHVGQ